MLSLKEIFDVEKPIIGVVHLLPLPGSPMFDGLIDAIIKRALSDASALVKNGVDGLIVENFGDKPFTKNRIPREGFALMSIIVKRIVDSFNVPVGVNVLRNDALSAMALAYASGADFIRVNVYTDTMVTDQGIIEPIAWRLLSYRRALNADVRIFADVLVKHAKPIVDISIRDSVKTAVYRGLADALIVTGSETGAPVDIDTLREAKEASGGVPVLAGSGVNLGNVAEILSLADGAIVGTFFKKDGLTENPVDGSRVKKLTSLVKKLFR